MTRADQDPPHGSSASLSATAQHVTKPAADARLRDLLEGVAAARRRGN